MIVFDVDGTLIGGEAVDFTSFDAAFEEAAGFALHPAFVDTLEDVTAEAIVRRALVNLAEEEWRRIGQAVQKGYLTRLRRAHSNDPMAFPATAGAIALLQTLKAQGFPVAIATGDWRETISFKLIAAGIPTDGIHLATASDHYGRTQIIADAVAKTGQSLSEAIYVGDGLWDLRACNKLGIPFIGVGRNIAALRAAGAAFILPDLTPEPFLETVRTIQGARRSPRASTQLKWPAPSPRAGSWPSGGRLRE